MPQNISDEQNIGIVFPIHSWYAPYPVIEFLSRLSLPAKAYRYAVCTCGDDAGKCMKRLRKYFKYNGAFSVRMPNTYIPMFDLDTDTIARLKVKDAHQRIDDIAYYVGKKKKMYDVFEGAFAYLKTYLIQPIFAKYIVSSKGFHLDNGCISCGTCSNVCPISNITMTDGRPQWGEQCIHCMACIHACPQKVIQYKDATQKRGRYQLNKYL